VDDFLIIDTAKLETDKIKEDLGQKYKMTDLGEAKRSLGLKVAKTDNGYPLG